MNTLVFFLATLALGTGFVSPKHFGANVSQEKAGIGPTPTDTSEPSGYDLMRTALDKNAQWLLRGIRDRRFQDPDFARAVVALFLAEPEYFSEGHEIGEELKNKVISTLIRNYGTPSSISSEELALYVQALLVSCVNPRNFFGYDLTFELWKSVFRHHCKAGVCNFPSSAMLTLCNARATAIEDIDRFFDHAASSSDFQLTDEEGFLTMAFECFKSQYPYPGKIPKDIRIQHPPIHRSGYRHYPSNLTVEDIQELMKPDGDPMGNTTSLSAIAAAMQTLMYNRRLLVSDIPSAVGFFLRSQDEDGSWEHSPLNSFFILPVLSNKSFLNITSDHCPERSENESFVEGGILVIYIMEDSLLKTILHYFHRQFDSLYGELTRITGQNITYHNGTDGKPYLHSIENRGNDPETGYFWFTYEQTKWPKESLTLLTQSHADIKFKPNRRYFLWYTRKSEEEPQQNNQI